MRRKVWSILMMLTIATTVWAQQKPKWAEEVDKLQVEINESRKQKQWSKLSDCMAKQEQVFHSHPEEERIKHIGISELSSNFYYNLACYSSLAGKVSRALKAFEKYTQMAVNKETEVNFIHIQSDTDLDPIRNTKRFKVCLEKLRPLGDQIQKLKDASGYQKGSAPESLRFRYMEPNDSNLVMLRQHYNLDSIAGAGDELSKIKNLLHWVHETVRHDGSSSNPQVKNTRAMIELCRKENRGVNCRMMAQMLAEVYLAMGFKARFVTCMPRDFINDCHVITTVYSCTLNKWLWVDPTFDAYVTDENGTMLSIAEVRTRLRKGQEVRLNDYANWNHQSKQTKEHYIDYYMAKNLYYIACMEESRFNAETWEKGRNYRYFILMPYKEVDKEIVGIGREYIRFTDADWFWQSPYEK